MEHTEETNLGSKVPGIAGDLQQSCSTGLKQQVIDQTLVLQCQRSQFPRQGEDHMHVAGGQQLPLSCMEWSQRRRALPWHRGQCRLRHELYEMAVCPQSEH